MITLEQIKSRVSESDTGCWIWLGCRNRKGYGNLRSGGKGYLVHRYVAALVGMDTKGRLVLHKCDNPPCCNPDHLFLGTAQDNTDDMMNKGRHKKAAKLTEDQVDTIRRKYSENPKLTQKELAKEYQVTSSNISAIVAKRSWGDGGGRLNFGARRGRKKLTEEQVKEIRRVHKETGRLCKDIAKDYNVHPSTICGIVSGKYWKHI